MSDNFLDHLPSSVQERLRKRMRSPEEYERLREKVKGPEDLEREMDRNELMAELRFNLETEPAMLEALKSAIDQDLREQGIESVLEADDLGTDGKKQIEAGKFRLTVSAHPSTHQDQLAVIPEGNVQETIPVKTSFAEKYVSQFVASMSQK